MRIKLPFGKTLILSAGFSARIVPSRDVDTVGFWDVCEDGLHVTVLDYDSIDKDFMLQDLQWLQKKFDIGDFYVMTTNEEVLELHGRKETVGSYHDVCFSKVPFATAVDIIEHSHCDYAFKRGARLNVARVWTLRASEDYRPKPRYVTTVKSNFGKSKQQSSAHAAFLKGHYGVPVQVFNPDGLETMYREFYKTYQKR